MRNAIKIDYKKIRYTITSLLLLTPFLKSTVLVEFSDSVGRYTNIALIAISCFLLILLCEKTKLKNGKVTRYSMLLVLYCLSVAPISLYSGLGQVQDIVSFYGSAFYHIVFCIYIGYHLKKDPESLVHIWAIAFNMLAVANVLSIYIFPEGIIKSGDWGITPYWLLGYDNQHMTTYIAAIVFASIDLYLRKGKIINLYIVVTYIAYLVVSIRLWTVTSFVDLIVFGFFFFGYYLFKRFRNVFNIKMFTIVIFLTTFLIIYLSQAGTSGSLLGQFIETVLQKDIGFNSRNWIWANTLNEIVKYPIFGHGYETQATMLSVLKASHPHNEWLNMLYEGGIVHFGFYLALLFYSARELIRNKKSPVSYVLTIYMLAIMITQMLVIYRQIQWMIAFVFAYNCKYLSCLTQDKAYVRTDCNKL